MEIQYSDVEGEDGIPRYSPPPPYNTHHTKHSYVSGGRKYPQDSDSERIELRIQCPTINSLRWCLKLYCLVFGGLGTILSSLWVVFHLYVLGETDSTDLRLQRYLDICLGVVMLASTLSLVYAGLIHSKTWLVVYTTGSILVIILYWSWTAYTSYVQLEQPAYYKEAEDILLVFSLLYCLSLIPVLLYYRALISTNNTREPESQRCCEDNSKHFSSPTHSEKV